jgi:hypothetical protein
MSTSQIRYLKYAKAPAETTLIHPPASKPHGHKSVPSDHPSNAPWKGKKEKDTAPSSKELPSKHKWKLQLRTVEKMPTPHGVPKIGSQRVCSDPEPNRQKQGSPPGSEPRPNPRAKHKRDLERRARGKVIPKDKYNKKMQRRHSETKWHPTRGYDGEGPPNEKDSKKKNPDGGEMKKGIMFLLCERKYCFAAVTPHYHTHPARRRIDKKKSKEAAEAKKKNTGVPATPPGCRAPPTFYQCIDGACSDSHYHTANQQLLLSPTNLVEQLQDELEKDEDYSALGSLGAEDLQEVSDAIPPYIMNASEKELTTMMNNIMYGGDHKEESKHQFTNQTTFKAPRPYVVPKSETKAVEYEEFTFTFLAPSAPGLDLSADPDGKQEEEDEESDDEPPPLIPAELPNLCERYSGVGCTPLVPIAEEAERGPSNWWEESMEDSAVREDPLVAVLAALAKRPERKWHQSDKEHKREVKAVVKAATAPLFPLARMPSTEDWEEEAPEWDHTHVIKIWIYSRNAHQKEGGVFRRALECVLDFVARGIPAVKATEDFVHNENFVNQEIFDRVNSRERRYELRLFSKNWRLLGAKKRKNRADQNALKGYDSATYSPIYVELFWILWHHKHLQVNPVHNDGTVNGSYDSQIQYISSQVTRGYQLHPELVVNTLRAVINQTAIRSAALKVAIPNKLDLGKASTGVYKNQLDFSCLPPSR